MSIATEMEAVEAFIFSKLAVDNSLKALIGSKIYADFPPQRARPPFAVYYQVEPGLPQVDISGLCIVQTLNYEIIGISTTGISHLITARIRQVLHRQSGTQGTFQIVQCMREMPIDNPPDRFNSKDYDIVGDRYGILVCDTT